jgi:anti-sigma regulatory factor (Ser/Thr protein kinase)
LTSLKGIAMTFNKLFLATLLTLSTAAALAAGEHGHGHDPQFGGVVVQTRAGDFEIVAKPDTLQIHISDHGKPVKLEGARAKITLLNGTEKSEAELLPAGDRLEAKGSFKAAKGTKGIAVVTLAGKPPATARFQLK